MSADQQVARAKQLYQAGNKAEARTILLAVIEQNERHEEAWLYLSAVTETLEEQQICLENVLAINPNNERAKQGLETVQRKLGGSAAPPAASGRTSSAPIGAEFATTSGDNLFETPGSQGNDAGFDWLSAAADQAASSEPDAFASATSVDWGRGDDAPAAHGSGRNVEMPSSQEYDDWVQNLNLDGVDSAAQSAAATPFDDTSFMVDDDFDTQQQPAAEPEPAATGFDAGSPFGSEFDSFSYDETRETLIDDEPANDTFGGSTFGAFDSDPVAEEPADDLFGSSVFDDNAGWADTASPFTGESFIDDEEETVEPEAEAVPGFGAAAATFETPGVFSEPEEPAFDAMPDASRPFGGGLEDDEPEMTFEFDDDDAPAAGEDDDGDMVFNFDDDDSPAVKAAPAKKKPAVDPKHAAYFAMIPNEIEASGGGFDQRSLLMVGGIALLLVLNLMSYLMLLL